MMISSTSFGSVARKWAFVAVALVTCFSVARAQDGQAVIAKVKSSVVQVNVGKSSLGSGCVVNAEKGIIVTNFHVVEHAKGEEVNVVFPADNDNKAYAVDGFLEILPGRDLALIHIDPSKRKLKALTLATSLPAMGEHVYAFGSPLGLSLSFTEGSVSAVRSGKQISEIMAKMAGDGYYEKHMGYDLKAQWIQHAVSISPGNSGGPLTNAKGEVLGLNTWNYGGTQGQNLNFAISALHIRQLLDSASQVVKSFSTLPPPRHKEAGGPGPGDPETTLASWKLFNKAMIVFNKKYAEAEKKLEAVPKANPRNPLQGKSVRDKKRSSAFKAYGAAYKEFAGKVKGLGSNRSINLKLIEWFVHEGDLLQRTGDSYQGLATSVATDSGMGELEEAKVAAYKLALDKLRSDYDALRIILSHTFNKDFPTIEDTENAPSDDSVADASKKKTDESSSSKGKTARDTEKRFETRTWTSRNGRFKIKAKLRGVEDDQVKLEKEDGSVIVVPTSKLSEADQRFLDETS